jgi:F-type H+-transporting ATPase subunit alpha
VAGSGGSLTLLPIVEVEGDVGTALAATVAPLADGPIHLSDELFRAGVRPAIDPGRLTGPIGPAPPAMKVLSKWLWLGYAALRELEAFAALGSELDRATRAQMDRGRRIVALFQQPAGRPMPLEEEVLVLYAGTAGHLDKVPLEQVRAFEEGLVAHARARHADALGSLDRPRLSVEEMRRTLDAVIEDFKIHFGTDAKLTAGERP